MRQNKKTVNDTMGSQENASGRPEGGTTLGQGAAGGQVLGLLRMRGFLAYP